MEDNKDAQKLFAELITINQTNNDNELEIPTNTNKCIVLHADNYNKLTTNSIASLLKSILTNIDDSNNKYEIMDASDKSKEEILSLMTNNSSTVLLVDTFNEFSVLIHDTIDKNMFIQELEKTKTNMYGFVRKTINSFPLYYIMSSIRKKLMKCVNLKNSRDISKLECLISDNISYKTIEERSDTEKEILIDYYDYKTNIKPSPYNSLATFEYQL